MARIVAVCLSDTKAVSKKPVDGGFLRENYGLVGDAHASPGADRQVSLLSTDSIEKMRRLGVELSAGDFAENLTVEGMDLVSLPIGTQLALGKSVILEVIQIGKECHSRCAVYRQVGKCVMPEEGVFARVIHGGLVKAGDQIRRRRLGGE